MSHADRGGEVRPLLAGPGWFNGVFGGITLLRGHCRDGRALASRCHRPWCPGRRAHLVGARRRRGRVVRSRPELSSPESFVRKEEAAGDGPIEARRSSPRVVELGEAAGARPRPSPGGRVVARSVTVARSSCRRRRRRGPWNRVPADGPASARRRPPRRSGSLGGGRRVCHRSTAGGAGVVAAWPSPPGDRDRGATFRGGGPGRRPRHPRSALSPRRSPSRPSPPPPCSSARATRRGPPAPGSRRGP